MGVKGLVDGGRFWEGFDCGCIGSFGDLGKGSRGGLGGGVGREGGVGDEGGSFCC